MTLARTGATLREGLQLFLDSRKSRLNAGEIVQRSYDDYKKECLKLRDLTKQRRDVSACRLARMCTVALSAEVVESTGLLASE